MDFQIGIARAGCEETGGCFFHAGDGGQPVGACLNGRIDAIESTCYGGGRLADGSGGDRCDSAGGCGVCSPRRSEWPLLFYSEEIRTGRAVDAGNRRERESAGVGPCSRDNTHNEISC